MKYKYLLIAGLGFAILRPYVAAAGPVTPDALGSADSFAVLAGSTVTNTNPEGNLPNGPTTVTGNVGVYSSGGANTVTGLAGTQVSGTIYPGGTVAQQAQADLNTAYRALAAMTPAINLTGQILGTDILILAPGVYHFDSASQLTGTLDLDAQGKNNAAWVFQIGTTLTTASDASVQVINPGSNSGADDGVFWQVGSSATLGTNTAFAGNIVALDDVTLNNGADIAYGRALAETGQVTMDTNVIGNAGPTINGAGYNGGLVYNNGALVPVIVAPAPPAFWLGLTTLLSLFGLMAVKRRNRAAKQMIFAYSR